MVKSTSFPHEAAADLCNFVTPQLRSYEDVELRSYADTKLHRAGGDNQKAIPGAVAKISLTHNNLCDFFQKSLDMETIPCYYTVKIW